MFMIRIWIRSSKHVEPMFLTGFEPTDFPSIFHTFWSLLGNKIQTYAKEEVARRAFNQLLERKAHLRFFQWDDSDALIEGPTYSGHDLKVTSYEIQLYEINNDGVRIAARFSGPA